MFVFGKEQPITNNQSLFEKKSGVNELCSDHSKGRGLNRYSFVSKDGNTDSLPQLVHALLNQAGSRIIVLVTWLVNLPGKSPIAAKIIEKKYLKDGWEVHIKNNHYFASKEIMLYEINSWPPLGIRPLDGGVLILVGNETKEKMLSAVNDDCSYFLAWTRYFAPDSEFFKQLELKNLSAIYQVNDDQNNTGLVFIGKATINMTSVQNVNIIETYEGSSAYKAFL